MLLGEKQRPGDVVTVATVGDGYKVAADAARRALGGVVGPGEDDFDRGSIQGLAIAGKGNAMRKVGIPYDLCLLGDFQNSGHLHPKRSSS